MIKLNNLNQNVKLTPKAIVKKAETTEEETAIFPDSNNNKTTGTTASEQAGAGASSNNTNKSKNSSLLNNPSSFQPYFNVDVVNESVLGSDGVYRIVPKLEIKPSAPINIGTGHEKVDSVTQADKETMTTTAQTVHDEVVSGVLNLFPNNDELYVNNDYNSIKSVLTPNLDESPVAVNLYVKNETARLLALSAKGSLTRDEYESSLRNTLYATYPGVSEMSATQKKELKNQLEKLSSSEITKLQDMILELPDKNSKDYAAKLNKITSELDTNKIVTRTVKSSVNSVRLTSKSPSGKSAVSGTEKVGFSEVFENSYGVEYDAEKMQAYNEAKNLYAVQLSVETSRKAAHDALDKASSAEDIEKGVFSVLNSLTTSTKDEDMTELLRNMTGMSNVSVKNGSIVASNMSAVKTNLLKTIDKNAENFYAETTPMTRMESSGGIVAATTSFESSYKDAFGEKSLKQTNQALENDNSSLASKIRTGLEWAGVASGVGAMATFNPILAGVSVGCSIMAPGVELIAELTGGNPSDEKIKELLGEMGVNAALAGFGAMAGALGSIAGKAASAIASKGKAVWSFLADKATDMLTSVMGNMVLTGNADVGGEMINQTLAMALGARGKNGISKDVFGKYGFSADDIKTDLYQAKTVLSDEEIAWVEKKYSKYGLSEPAMDAYGELINRVMNGEVVGKKMLNQILDEVADKHGVDSDDLRDALEGVMEKTEMADLLDCIEQMTPSKINNFEDEYNDYAQDCREKINKRLGIETPEEPESNKPDSTENDKVDNNDDVNKPEADKDVDSADDVNSPEVVDDVDGADNVNKPEADKDVDSADDVNSPDGDNDADGADNVNKPEADREHIDDVMHEYRFSDEDCVKYSDDIIDNIKAKYPDNDYSINNVENMIHDYLQDYSLLASDVRKMTQRIADELGLEKNEKFMDDFNEKMNESPEYKDELHEMIDEQLRATVKQNRKNYEKEICDENNMRDYSSYELSESIIKDMEQKIEQDEEWATPKNVEEYLYDQIDPNKVDYNYRDTEAIVQRVMNSIDSKIIKEMQENYLMNKNSLPEPQNTTQKIIDRTIREILSGEEDDEIEDEDEDDFNDINNSSGNSGNSTPGVSGNGNDYGDINNSSGNRGDAGGNNSGIPEYDYPEPDIPNNGEPDDVDNDTGNNHGPSQPDVLPDAGTPDNGTPSSGEPDIPGGTDAPDFGDGAVINDEGKVYIPNNDNQGTWVDGTEDVPGFYDDRDKLNEDEMTDILNDYYDKYGDDYNIYVNDYGDVMLEPKNDNDSGYNDDSGDYGDSGGYDDGYGDDWYDDGYGDDWLDDWLDDEYGDDDWLDDWYDDGYGDDWLDDWDWGNDDWGDYDIYLA